MTGDRCNRGIDRAWAPKAGEVRRGGPQGLKAVSQAGKETI